VTAIQSPRILDALKRSATTLRDAGVPFALGGGLSAWARGGPTTEHDIDYFVRPVDAEAALDALATAGMRTARPPEGWLLKAWCDDVLIDLIFAPRGFTVDDAFFARCEMMDVEAVAMLVMPLEELFVGRLLVLSEHHLAFEPLLEYARSLREQIDWQVVRERTAHSPFARAFFSLLEELGVLPHAVRSARS